MTAQLIIRKLVFLEILLFFLSLCSSALDCSIGTSKIDAAMKFNSSPQNDSGYDAGYGTSFSDPQQAPGNSSSSSLMVKKNTVTIEKKLKQDASLQKTFQSSRKIKRITQIWKEHKKKIDDNFLTQIKSLGWMVMAIGILLAFIGGYLSLDFKGLLSYLVKVSFIAIILINTGTIIDKLAEYAEETLKELSYSSSLTKKAREMRRENPENICPSSKTISLSKGDKEDIINSHKSNKISRKISKSCCSTICSKINKDNEGKKLCEWSCDFEKTADYLSALWTIEGYIESDKAESEGRTQNSQSSYNMGHIKFMLLFTVIKLFIFVITIIISGFSLFVIPLMLSIAYITIHLSLPFAALPPPFGGSLAETLKSFLILLLGPVLIVVVTTLFLDLSLIPLELVVEELNKPNAKWGEIQGGWPLMSSIAILILGGLGAYPAYKMLFSSAGDLAGGFAKAAAQIAGAGMSAVVKAPMKGAGMAAGAVAGTAIGGNKLTKKIFGGEKGKTGKSGDQGAKGGEGAEKSAGGLNADQTKSAKEKSDSTNSSGEPVKTDIPKKESAKDASSASSGAAAVSSKKEPEKAAEEAKSSKSGETEAKQGAAVTASDSQSQENGGLETQNSDKTGKSEESQSSESSSEADSLSKTENEEKAENEAPASSESDQGKGSDSESESDTEENEGLWSKTKSGLKKAKDGIDKTRKGVADAMDTAEALEGKVDEKIDRIKDSFNTKGIMSGDLGGEISDTASKSYKALKNAPAVKKAVSVAKEKLEELTPLKKEEEVIITPEEKAEEKESKKKSVGGNSKKDGPEAKKKGPKK